MVIKLSPSQIEILKILSEQNKPMGNNEIRKYSNINPMNIANAINFLARKDLVYQPDIQGKVEISPDGEDALSYYL